MIKFHLGLLALVLSLFASLGCKTPAGMRTGSSVYDGGAPAKAQDAVGESAEASCGRFGGEMIDGACICADGTPKSKIQGAEHCSAWVKKKYPDCYEKGGMPKAFGKDTQALCVCSYGEALAAGSASCYDQFKAKYADCAQKGGIVLANDSICRCLHGTPALKLAGTCEDDFRKDNESCAKKLGVTSEGSACRCRDGSILDKDEKSVCAEPWFFYSKKAIADAQSQKVEPSTTASGEQKPEGGEGQDPLKNSEDTTGQIAQKSDATCMCQHYKDHCIIYKPGDETAIKWLKTTANNCTRNACYKNFSDIIFEKKSDKAGAGGCDGSWDYKATVAKDGEPAAAEDKDEKVDIAKYCVCKPLRKSNPVGCGLYLPGKSVPNTYANTASTCTPDNCVSLFGNSYTLKTHCYDAATKKYLWRHQD